MRIRQLSIPRQIAALRDAYQRYAQRMAVAAVGVRPIAERLQVGACDNGLRTAFLRARSRQWVLQPGRQGRRCGIT